MRALINRNPLIVCSFFSLLFLCDQKTFSQTSPMPNNVEEIRLSLKISGHTTLQTILRMRAQQEEGAPKEALLLLWASGDGEPIKTSTKTARVVPQEYRKALFEILNRTDFFTDDMKPCFSTPGTLRTISLLRTVRNPSPGPLVPEIYAFYRNEISYSFVSCDPAKFQGDLTQIGQLILAAIEDENTKPLSP